MKKILSILLAVLLLAPAAGSAFAVIDDDADVRSPASHCASPRLTGRQKA